MARVVVDQQRRRDPHRLVRGDRQRAVLGDRTDRLIEHISVGRADDVEIVDQAPLEVTLVGAGHADARNRKTVNATVGHAPCRGRDRRVRAAGDNARGNRRAHGDRCKLVTPGPGRDRPGIDRTGLPRRAADDPGDVEARNDPARSLRCGIDDEYMSGVLLGHLGDTALERRVAGHGRSQVARDLPRGRVERAM